jgi:hypothetical protein
MRSWTVSWLSLKNKVEPGQHGSRVMSGDWRRLHRVCGISSSSPENHWVPQLIHKAKTEEPKTEVQQHQTGLTGGSDRWVPVRPVRSTSLTGVRRHSPETSKHSSGYVVLTSLGIRVGDMCLMSCSSCWSLYLLREEFLSASIHSPLSGSPFRSFKWYQSRLRVLIDSN